MRTAISHRSHHRRPARRRYPARGPGARRATPRPSYLGARLRRPLFLPPRTQQVKTLSRAAAWAGGGAMVLAMASWGLLVALLAS